jgi:hypothetical protein
MGAGLGLKEKLTVERHFSFHFPKHRLKANEDIVRMNSIAPKLCLGAPYGPAQNSISRRFNSGVGGDGIGNATTSADAFPNGVWKRGGNDHEKPAWAPQSMKYLNR